MSIKNNVKRQILYAGIAFGLIALLLGAWSQFNVHPPKTKELVLQNGTAFPVPRKPQPFALQYAKDGKPFTNAQLQGHWSMMFFGFTHCAMLCPTTLSTLNQFYGKLESANFKEMPQIIFVSIDPERDSLKRIDTYVTSFNKNFQGATASEEVLDKVTNEFNILFTKVNPTNDKDYQIDHSGTVLLFDPRGNLAGLFSPPIDAKTLAEDYKAIIAHAKE